MVNISQKAQLMPASAIRKLIPLSDAAKKQGVKVYHLNMGQPDSKINSPECALDAVRNYKGVNIPYSNSAGLIELREGLVNKYYKKIGINIEVPELLVTVAGSESVLMSLEITCNAGDEVIVLEPFYTNYNTFAFMNEITLKAVPTDIRNGFQLPPVEEFEKAITDRTKAILICNPGNPTGTLYSKESMLALGEIVKKHEIASIGALDTTDEYLQDVRAEYIRRRNYMIENLNKIPGVFTPMPMGAFYTVAELPVDDTEKFARWMLEEFRYNGETTMVTPAASFFKTPGKGKNYARIAYVLEIPELEKALKCLAEGLKAYPGKTN